MNVHIKISVERCQQIDLNEYSCIYLEIQVFWRGKAPKVKYARLTS